MFVGSLQQGIVSVNSAEHCFRPCYDIARKQNKHAVCYRSILFGCRESYCNVKVSVAIMRLNCGSTWEAEQQHMKVEMSMSSCLRSNFLYLHEGVVPAKSSIFRTLDLRSTTSIERRKRFLARYMITFASLWFRNAN